jgi:hypothetical protein
MSGISAHQRAYLAHCPKQSRSAHPFPDDEESEPCVRKERNNKYLLTTIMKLKKLIFVQQFRVLVSKNGYIQAL